MYILLLNVYAAGILVNKRITGCTAIKSNVQAQNFEFKMS